jgi:hypothetical protein
MVHYYKANFEWHHDVGSCIRWCCCFSHLRNLHGHNVGVPVTVAEWSKACTVFAHSEPGIMGLNPTQGMDV